MTRFKYLSFPTAIIAIIFIAGCANREGAGNSISNDYVKLEVNIEKGTYSFIDLFTGDTVVNSASLLYVTDQPYERARIKMKFFRPVADTPGNTYSTSDPGRKNMVNSSKIKGDKGKSKILRFRSTMEGKNVLFAEFSIPSGKNYVDISWGFKNLGTEAVNVNKVDILHGSRAFSDSRAGDEIFMMEGNGGGRHNEVTNEGDVISYNSMLLARKREGKFRSIAFGGIAYEDFVKYAEVRDKGHKELAMYVEDPVGKRVDPGKEYASPDRFYIEYMSPDPFEAMELFGETLQKTMGINLDYYTFPSVCMWFLSVQHFGGDATSTNDTPGAVQEMKNAANSGFLKYAPVCIRLVPDNYEQNNQQGWWDDEHWQMYGRKERCIVEGGHYKPPYETTEKWAGKVTSLGGIPITYMQPGVRSEDYAEAFPEHMLFNEAHRYILRDGERFVQGHQIIGGIYGKLMQENYDYTDTGFVSHIKNVYKNLREGGVRGSFYDYPERAFPVLGGMDDKYTTAAAHYRKVFRLADEGFGNPNYIQERNIDMGSDITLGYVTSQRTQGDNNVLSPPAVRSVGLRWYKNRSVVNYDMDGKAILVKGSRQDIPISDEERRAILTMSYTVTGRLLLTESFSRFDKEVLYDLSRIYPFHDTKLSPRPVDAFINEMPGIYDFNISPDWHQVVLFNENNDQSKLVNIPLSAANTEGGLALNENDSYYFYDFWNDKFIGLKEGSAILKQELRKEEARVISVHKKQDHPQFISTDRHILQGYVDMPGKPEWDNESKVLAGTSSVVENEPYTLIIALNGQSISSVSSGDCKIGYTLSEDNLLAKVVLLSLENKDAKWSITFEK